MSKRCRVCKEIKNLNKFPKDKKNKDGYSNRCSECNKKARKDWYKKNRESVLQKEKLRYVEEAESIKQYQKEYYQKNKKSINKRNSDWLKDNRDKANKAVRLWRASGSETAQNDRLRNDLRKRILNALNGKDKSAKSMELIGCDINCLREHLESQFKDGMTWENRGLHGWHIDHIIPCASFDLSKEDEQKKCFHYTNLQPLWAKENLRKSDSIIP